MKLLHYAFLVASLIAIGSCAISRGPVAPEPEFTFLSAVVMDGVTEDCPFGCPVGHTEESVIVDRDIYTLAFNRRTKFADWVSFSLKKDSIGKTRPRDWQVDDNFPPNKRINEADWADAYAKVGYERGHLALLTDFTGLADDQWQQANILSNIVPQCGEFNVGPWGALEEAEKKLAQSIDQPILISVGSLYELPMPGLPSAKLQNGRPKPHVVPSGFWKVIAIENGQKVEVAAFNFDQYHLIPRSCKRGSTGSEGRNYCPALVPLSLVEEAASLNLLPIIDANRIKDASKVPTRLLERLGCPQPN